MKKDFIRYTIIAFLTSIPFYFLTVLFVDFLKFKVWFTLPILIIIQHLIRYYFIYEVK